MSTNEHVTHFRSSPTFLSELRKRVEVAKRFRHLSVVDLQVSAVHPVVDKFATIGRFTLSNLVLVVRKHVIDTTRVHIEVIAESGFCHGGTFDVPAWTAEAPGAFPFNVAISFVVGFPESEIGN